MKTLKEILFLSEQFLKKASVERPKFSAEEIIALALGCKRLDLYMDFERPLLEEELDKIRSLLKKRADKIPFPYLAGSVEFYQCEIEVNPSVLIPRPETEILVDIIVKELEKNSSVSSLTLWDLCTGSGCIAIAIKKKIPTIHVLASDISSQALELAKKNAQLNEVDIEFRQGDFLEPFSGQKADVIISNPPYISDGEFESLGEEVRCHEPKEALIASNDGVYFYQKLAQEGPKHLNPAGKIFLEIGKDQGQKIGEIFSIFPGCKKSLLLPDWAGHDRFFFLEIE